MGQGLEIELAVAEEEGVFADGGIECEKAFAEFLPFVESEAAIVEVELLNDVVSESAEFPGVCKPLVVGLHL